MRNTIILTTLLSVTCSIHAEPWVADLGDGNYRNPVIFADYSDPDVVRVGEDFFMTASSFNSVPALPILHSRDLVNWELVNHAVKRFPDSSYDLPQHGRGVWAPAIRHHEGWFYIYWGDPDRGIFRVKTRDPFGEWEAPILVHQTVGTIDPCPIWDDDGQVYLVHAFANSRANLKSVLQVAELTRDGAELTVNKRIVFLGHDTQPTIEGPKFLKRNGYYYILAPAGGVAQGWQTVLRSRSIWGPYEEKIVLARGSTEINGPHQGAFIELENGEGWFIHFQERQPWGRIIHLQPVKWVDDWPVIGNDPDGDGCGEPFLIHPKPSLPTQPLKTPPVGDDFRGSGLSLAWQWHASPFPGWFEHFMEQGILRLNAVQSRQRHQNLWTVPHLLLQKLPAPSFHTTVELDPDALLPGERGGLVVMGQNYAAIVVERLRTGALQLSYVRCIDAEKLLPEEVLATVELPENAGKLRFECRVDTSGICHFSWAAGENAAQPFAVSFKAREGRWIGAKIGLFSQSFRTVGEVGWIDFKNFRID